MKYSVVMLALMALTVGCGTGDGAPGPQSSVVASGGSSEGESDEVTINAVTYTSKSDSTTVVALRAPAGDDHAIEAVEIDLVDFFPQHLVAPGSAGVANELWVIGSSATGSPAARSYKDDDQDGLVEPTNWTAMFSLPTGFEIVGQSCLDESSGALFLIDEESHDVFRATDTNADLRPDQLSSVPFAAATWDPATTGPQTFDYTDPDSGVITTFPTGVPALATKMSNPGLSEVTLWAVGEIGRIVDTDADGIADIVSLSSETLTPTIMEPRLFDGMWKIHVTADRGSTIEVRRVDASGGILAVLATGTAGDGPTAFVLSSELVEDQWIEVVDTTLLLDSARVGVFPTRAVVDPAPPISIDLNTSHVLSFAGANLDRVDSVKLYKGGSHDTSPTTLTFVVSLDGRTLTATIPQNVVTWSGGGLVFMQDDDDDPKLVFSAGCSVCAAGG